jgi:hypothetical protein
MCITYMKQNSESPVKDSFGFFLYATEQNYCKKNGLVQFYDLDWLSDRESFEMRKFAKTAKGKKFLADPRIVQQIKNGDLVI